MEGNTSHLPPVLNARVFVQDSLILIVSPGHRWCTIDVLQSEELARPELVLREQGSGTREVIEQELLRKLFSELTNSYPVRHGHFMICSFLLKPEYKRAARHIVTWRDLSGKSPAGSHNAF